MKKLFFLFVGIVVLLACSPKVTDTDSVDAMTAEAAQGKSIFSQKCSKCHDLPVVDKYSKEKWDKVLPPMAEKAELSEAEKAQVEAYVNWELRH